MATDDLTAAEADETASAAWPNGFSATAGQLMSALADSNSVSKI